MRKLDQTRLHSEEVRGNCFPAVIAMCMGLFSAEDVIQIQEHYDDPNWPTTLDDWLTGHKFEWERIEGHLYNDEYYFVIGYSPRNISHVCIYQNGELYHDPHPSRLGLVTEREFAKITDVGPRYKFA